MTRIESSREREIERASQEVLDCHDQGTLPIDPRAIAEAEDIVLADGTYDDCFDGRIAYSAKHRKFILFYARERLPHRPAARVRFSIAHELGHYFLHEHRALLLGGDVHSSAAGFSSPKQREREADFFAASLLMPREPFLQVVRSRPGSFATLVDLETMAEKNFQTSLISTGIRYAQLSPEACCIVQSKAGKVLYAYPSEDFKALGLGWIAPASAVPRPTVTFRAFQERPATGRMDGEVSSRAWFDRGADVALWEETRLLGSSDVAITLLASVS